MWIGGIVEALDEICDGGFAGAGETDYGDCFAGRDVQVYVAEDGVVRTGRVGESYVFEGDFTFEGEFTVADGFFCLAGQGGQGKDMVCGFL